MKFVRWLCVALLIIAFFTGCSCKRYQGALAGALAGAAAGAGGGYAIGEDSDEEGESAAIGAVVGAVVGGITGALICRGQAVSDYDGDGVPDASDECPNTPQGVKVDAKGCPVDSDGDLIPDYLDACPDTPKGVAVDEKGCPLDSDGDGVPDHLDQCPDTPAGKEVDATGCTMVSEEVKEKAAAETLFVLEGIFFGFDSAQISKSGRSSLDESALRALMENPDLKVKIVGHTDSTGPADYNSRLSLLRAVAVKKYLVSQGIDADRMAVFGEGEARPIASNDTKEGRTKNRRIEFLILAK